MTAELVRGENRQLYGTRWEVRVSAGRPVIAGATLNDAQGRIREAGWIAHPAAHRVPGVEVSRQAATEHRLAVDLGALPADAHRVNVWLALPSGVPGPTDFGSLAAPFTAVTDLDGAAAAHYTVTGLRSETAVVAVELYRRAHCWKVRAVGQGYAGGLVALLGDQGSGRAEELAAQINEAVAAGLARSVPPPSQGSAQPPQDRSAARIGGRPAAAAEPGEPAPDGGQATGTSPGNRTPGGSPPNTGRPDASSSHTGSSHPGPQADTGRADTGRGTGTTAGAGTSGGINYRHPHRSSPGPHSAGAAAGEAGPTAPTGSQAPPQGDTPAAEAVPGGAAGSPAEPVAGDAAGWSLDERLYNQIWGMFEDLARTVAAYRSAMDFADSRRDRELDSTLDDPQARSSPTAAAARSEAQRKHARLAGEAEEVLGRDLRQLTAEAAVVEPALPRAYARWDNPVWHTRELAEDSPVAVRLGDLTLPECPDLHIPLLVRLPLARGLWIDTGRATDGSAPGGPGAVHGMDSAELRRRAGDMATALAARLLAVHPPGEFSLSVIDPAGAAAAALAPLTGSGVLSAPPATGAAGVRETLEQLTRRVDLVQMASRGDAASALPADVDRAEQVLLVHDFPHGFDDRTVHQLRYLLDEGPSVGVNVLLVADRSDASAYGPVLDPLWRSLLRLTPVPDDHLADPWVGHAWTYRPPLVPPGSAVLSDVLQRVAQARQ